MRIFVVNTKSTVIRKLLYKQVENYLIVKSLDAYFLGYLIYSCGYNDDCGMVLCLELLLFLFVFLISAYSAS